MNAKECPRRRSENLRQQSILSTQGCCRIPWVELLTTEEFLKEMTTKSTIIHEIR